MAWDYKQGSILNLMNVENYQFLAADPRRVALIISLYGGEGTFSFSDANVNTGAGYRLSSSYPIPLKILRCEVGPLATYAWLASCAAAMTFTWWECLYLGE